MMENHIPGTNFAFEFRQIFYEAIGCTRGQPKRIHVEVHIKNGESYPWLIEPKYLSAQNLIKAFWDVQISRGVIARLNDLLRGEFNKILIDRPYSALERPQRQTQLAVPEQQEHCYSLPGVYLNKSGWQRLPSGKVVFVAGDQIIGDPGVDFFIDPAIAKIHLPVLPDTEPIHVQTFLERLLLEPNVYLPIWGFTLTTALHSMIAQAGVHFQAAALLLGKYSAGKSALSEMLFALYDKTEYPGEPALFFDLESSFPALREAACAFQDIPVVADDRCTSGDSETVRKRAQTAAKLLRLATNRSTQAKGAKSTREELRAVAGVAISAEMGSALNSESDWSRFLPILLSSNRKLLPWGTRSIAAFVLYGFLAWVAPQYDSLLQKIQSDYQEVLHDTPSQDLRSSTMHFAINWVSYCFCRFCEECGGITSSDANALFKKFTDACQLCVQYQQQQIQLIQYQRPTKTIPQLLVQGLKPDLLSICNKKKKVNEYAGWEDDNKLYLWPDAVYQWISSQPGYQDITKIQISKALKRYGILIFEYSGASDNTVHVEISGERRRFLCINKDILYRAAAQDNYTE